MIKLLLKIVGCISLVITGVIGWYGVSFYDPNPHPHGVGEIFNNIFLSAFIFFSLVSAGLLFKGFSKK